MSAETISLVAPPKSHGGVGAYTEELVAHFDRPVRRVYVNREWTNPLRYLRVALDASRGSVVHFQYVYGMYGPKGVFTLLVLPLVAMLTDGPVVVTLHEVWTREDTGGSRVKYAYLRFVHETLARFADELVFLSANAEQEFLESVPSAETRVMAHGVKTADPEYSHAEAKASFGYDADTTLVTLHGFLSERKGCDRFLDLAESMPDYEFLLAGGSRREDLEDRLRERAPENAQITGVLDDDRFEASFVASDLAVLPYQEISQSGIFNRCATYRLPVVATPIPYFEQLADEYGCVETAEIDHLDEVVRTILEDVDRRQELLARIGRYRTENSFAAIATQTEQLY